MEVGGKYPGTTIQFFLISPQLPPRPPPNVMILGPGLKVPVPEAGMIPMQETVIVPLNLYA